MDKQPTPPLSPELQSKLAALPLATYQTGQTVIAAGAKTGLLLVLKGGSVSIIKESVEIARVDQPGSIFGEMSALLDEPHTAEVRALEPSQFYVADAAAIMKDAGSLLYVATLLARRLEATNVALYELKTELDRGATSEAVTRTVGALELLLNTSTPAPRRSRLFAKR
jgi:CRP/FNR family cyclic AMP-dependent transcriptional regulator